MNGSVTVWFICVSYFISLRLGQTFPLGLLQLTIINVSFIHLSRTGMISVHSMILYAVQEQTRMRTHAYSYTRILTFPWEYELRFLSIYQIIVQHNLYRFVSMFSFSEFKQLYRVPTTPAWVFGCWFDNCHILLSRPSPTAAQESSMLCLYKVGRVQLSQIT